MRMLAARQTPPRLSTAMSVVPAPISTTIRPAASPMGRPAPMAAARGASMRNTFLAPACRPACTTARSSTELMLPGTLNSSRGFTVLKGRMLRRCSRRSFTAMS